MLGYIDKSTKKGTSLTRKGYILNKSDFSEKKLQFVRNQLTVKPVVHRDFAHFAEEFPVFYESKTKLYLPRYWGLENFGPPEKINICDGDSINLKCVYEPRPIQKPIIDNALKILQMPFSEFMLKTETIKKKEVQYKLYGGGTIISIPCGLGKCMGKDTPILMYDGKIKMVQDVKVGDKLMGDDSKHRNVLSICNGKEQLYKIIPKRGNPYIVNESHILSLKCSTKNRFGDKNNTFDIPLKEYLNLPKHYRGRGSPICGYKVPVEFPEKEVDLEPYALGYWLGDGTSGDAQITTQDDEVVEYFQKYIKQLGGYVHQGKDSATTRHSLHYSFRKCEFKNYLRKYNLLKNKHIPHIYKCNSRENRLKLLAGLLDSDGYYSSKNSSMYSITQKNEQLLDDIVYLCLSLGFYAHKREVWKSCTNGKNKEKRLYYVTTISGYGLEEIPVIIDRKKCQPRKQIKNPLHSLITVEKLEVGDYYGFQIDGNRRFLLGDFTVTHNTFCALYIMTKLAQKTLIIVHTSVLLTQWIERIEQFVPGARVGIIKGKKSDTEDKDIVIAMLQTLVSENRVFPKGFFNQFGLAVADEVHHLAAPTFSRALPLMATKYFLGLSATPTRNDKLEKVFYWHLGYIGNQLIKQRGKEVLVKMINYTNPKFCELRRYNGRTRRNDAYDIPKMVDLIISCKRRLKFIRYQLKIFAEQGRQILVLSSRKLHLKDLKENFDSFNYTKLVDGEEVPITTGYYMGGMKKVELDESAKCDIIYGTFNLVAEGTDIPTLNTLLMACPRKEVEQVVGRILRADTGFIPVVIDMTDTFSIFVNQGLYRQRFYKRQNYHIDQFDIDKENYKTFKLTDCKQTEGLKRGRNKKENVEVEFKGLAILDDSDDE